MEGSTLISIEELKNNYDELGSINEKQEQRVRYTETQIATFVISYVLFQAIIFLSISSSSSNYTERPRCERTWVPFSMSLMIAILFGVTFVTKTHEWIRTMYEYDMNLIGRESMYNLMRTLRRKPSEQYCGDVSKETTYTPDEVRLFKRNVFVYATALLLIGYTVTILMVCAQSSALCK